MKLNPQECIRKLLLRGFSEKKIAEKARVSQSTIHRIKVGDTAYPRIDTADKLQEIYEKHGDLGGV
tara:strand:- start:24770 stop:24967 length:198 start_codon:yes stop_codon:yes gene_type:complete